MNKMCQNTGVVLWIRVIAFGVIWVLQDTGALDQVGRQGGNRSVATVNGEDISYDQFTQMLQQYRQQYQDRTGQSVPPQVEDQYRDQVYNSLVNNQLREQQMNELGIDVARSEIVQMVLGENPDPFIRQQFGNEQVQTDRATLVVEEGSGTVDARPSQLTGLFENLFRNAVEHAGPDVTVRVGPMDAGFYVADDGPGIPEGERESVFDVGETSQADGTGMGLAIVEQIAGAHGWTVSLAESADGGARFEFDVAGE
jgi:signal transduction histidine kinase